MVMVMTAMQMKMIVEWWAAWTRSGMIVVAVVVVVVVGLLLVNIVSGWKMHLPKRTWILVHSWDPGTGMSATGAMMCACSFQDEIVMLGADSSVNEEQLTFQ